MTIIDSTTVAVDNSAELKTILEGDNTYTLIYFGADIKLTSGISIRPTKSEIVIDGTYNSVRHTYEDMQSAAYGNTIYINSASNVNVTMQNMDITGHNYYGVIATADSSALSGVVTTYKNITYVGPQMVYNAYGKTQFIDCNIKIQASTSPANEVAETGRLEIGGTTTIVHGGSALSMFWFRGSNAYTLDILPNSNVHLESTSSYMNFIDAARTLGITFGSGSVTNIKLQHAMCYTGQSINDFIIESDAEVNIQQMQSYGSNATLTLRSKFMMNNNSSLKMLNDFVGNPGNDSLSFVTASASMSINNPKSFVVYNSTTNLMRTTYSIPFSLNISQYNRWTSSLKPLPTAGDIYDIPTYSWYKLETLGNLLISGNFTPTGTTITSHNLTPDELSKLPALTNFVFNNTKNFSMGRPSLTINPITDSSTEISGTTVPFADVRITYDNVHHYVQADSNGDFVYTYTTPLPIGTPINFVANLAHSFLYRFRGVEIVFEGDLQIVSATNQVTFSNIPFKASPTLFKRSGPLEVTVNDSRIIPTVWYLYASIEKQPTDDDNDVLTDGIVFVDGANNMTVLSDIPQLVYTSDGLATGDIIVDWLDEEGILLQLNIVPIKIGKVYRTTINWSIDS